MKDFALVDARVSKEKALSRYENRGSKKRAFQCSCSIVTFQRPLSVCCKYPLQETINGNEPAQPRSPSLLPSRYSANTRLKHWKCQTRTVLGSQRLLSPVTFVVNIADYRQLLAYHRFDSTVHLVLNKTGKERYSIPVFFVFNEDAELKALPSCRKDGVQYEKKRTGTYTTERLTLSRCKYPGQKVE